MEVHVSQRNAATLLLTAGAVAMLDYAGVNGKHSEGLFARRERELDFFITGIGYDSKGQRINP
jgi:hypothetical protein